MNAATTTERIIITLTSEEAESLGAIRGSHVEQVLFSGHRGVAESTLDGEWGDWSQKVAEAVDRHMRAQTKALKSALLDAYGVTVACAHPHPMARNLSVWAMEIEPGVYAPVQFVRA